MKFLRTVLTGACASLLLCSQLPAQQYYNSDCCDPCYDPCGCDNQFWIDAEYLYWTIKDSPSTVPLVITGPDVDITLDSPGTSVVLGRDKHKHKWRSGAKIGLGYAFDQCWGIEGSYFILPDEKRHHSVSSSGLAGSDILAIPFIDATTGLEATELLALPGVFAGFASLKEKNRLQGAELNGVYIFPSDCCSDYKIGVLAGFRWWNFDERLTFFGSSPFVPPVPETDIFEFEDKFETKNNFFGGQIGIGFEYNYCDFLFSAKAKVALGAMHEELDINGVFVTNDFVGFDPNPPETFVGGFFAQPTNIGKHKHNKFAVIPEINLNLGYKITDCFAIKVGYTFLYVNRVLRAANQIDRVINPTQSVLINGEDAALVGVAAPLARHKSSTFWAQGLNVGFEFAF